MIFLVLLIRMLVCLMYVQRATKKKLRVWRRKINNLKRSEQKKTK
ncbi:CLUMA_CG016592, isoform A [Clunio marinus]|uniref:CLUMA_CG016592, isoform A n=1 Tax=Clunio marinus TaxID=568069 RepID=A0A1J1ITM4_9DIPT|nr:CLUMA_CG016592, isoform A [Clunio marinus]